MKVDAAPNIYVVGSGSHAPVCVGSSLATLTHLHDGLFVTTLQAVENAKAQNV